MKKTLTILTLSFSLIYTGIFAQTGLDKGFAGTGKLTRSLTPGFDFSTATAVQSDGKILVTGYATFTGNTNMILLRYLENGLMDVSFGDSGTVIGDFGKAEMAFTLLVQPDGKILLGGQGNPGSNNDYALVRYKTNGRLDSSFGVNGYVTAAVGNYDDIIQAITLQKDGRIVVAGYSGAYPNYDFSLMRFEANGKIDSSFSSDGRLIMPIGSAMDIATGVRIQSNGKIVVCGRSVRGGAYDFAVIRLMPDGLPDFDFASSGVALTAIGGADDGASAMLIQPDHKILVGGYGNTGSFNDFALVRYDTSGFPDPSFSGDGKQSLAIGTENDGAVAMSLQTDGKIVLGGTSKIGPYTNFALARFKSNGNPDTSFGTNGKTSFAIGTTNDAMLGMALQSDGKIITAGVSHNGSDYDLALARFIPGKGSSIQAQMRSTMNLNAWPNPVTGLLKLTYELAGTGNVSIELSDIHGRLITRFVENDMQQAGLQEFALQLPEGIAAGIYMLKVSGAFGVLALPIRVQ
jgi:uncharacterized delta-60 repeat protein